MAKVKVGCRATICYAEKQWRVVPGARGRFSGKQNFAIGTHRGLFPRLKLSRGLKRGRRLAEDVFTSVYPLNRSRCRILNSPGEHK
jgi:hypothetical protein